MEGNIESPQRGRVTSTEHRHHRKDPQTATHRTRVHGPSQQTRFRCMFISPLRHVFIHAQLHTLDTSMGVTRESWWCTVCGVCGGGCLGDFAQTRGELSFVFMCCPMGRRENSPTSRERAPGGCEGREDPSRRRTIRARGDAVGPRQNDNAAHLQQCSLSSPALHRGSPADRGHFPTADRQLQGGGQGRWGTSPQKSQPNDTHRQHRTDTSHKRTQTSQVTAQLHFTLPHSTST